jgi:hypothetical protein
MLGFDFLGRTKSTIQYKTVYSSTWQNCCNLYKKAEIKAANVLNVILAKTNPIKCRIVLKKEKSKGRILKTRGGKKCKNGYSKRMAIRQQTPWVLVTSLHQSEFEANQIILLYKKRMQIEEDFRDTKSVRYGFSLRHCLSNSAARIEILLLFAALAGLLCWLVALYAYAKKLHYDYQANTVKTQNVLSVIYLGCQMMRRHIFISLTEAFLALKQLQLLVKGASL